MNVLEGTVKFVNLVEHAEYNGQSTGAYDITVALDDETAQTLADKGVRLKTYKGEQQRKFKSKFEVKTFDAEGQPIAPGEIQWGDKVRLKFAYGNEHPQWGTTCYVNAVKLLEKGEANDEDSGDF